MVRRKFAAVGAALIVALCAGAVWAQVGFKATTILQTTTTATGQPISFPIFRNQVTALVVEIAPGGQAGRHQHPVPVFVYVLEGELTWEAEGQPTRVYKTGQATLEDVGMWHNAFNRGPGRLRFLVVFLGEEGKPNTIRP